MNDLQLAITVMAYGLALWLVMGAVVALVWYTLFRYCEYRRKMRFIRAWNEWMGFSK